MLLYGQCAEKFSKMIFALYWACSNVCKTSSFSFYNSLRLFLLSLSIELETDIETG